MKDLYEALCEWLSIHPITTGGILAVTLTAFRVALAENRKSFGFVCLEGLSCGLLSMAFSYTAINMLNMDPSIGIFMGSTAGFIGLERIQALFIRLLDKWVAIKTGEKNDGNAPD